MYKVFLVEDEIFVRESMRESNVWKENEFVLAGEAADGEMALPLIEEIKPDILITDIKMPFLDGLELSRIIKKNMPFIKIIILSGYDEFSYAKEAMSIGITEYIVKPIGAEELLKALKGVTAQIEAEKKERESYEDVHKRLKDSMEIMKERFLNDLSTGVIPAVEAIEKAKSIGISIFKRYYSIALIIPDVKFKNSSKLEYSEYMKAECIINEIIKSNNDILKFNRNLKEIVLIFKGDSLDELENHCYAIAKSIKNEVEKSTECLLTISIGGVKERIQGIAESFSEAKTAWNFNYIFGKNKIIGIKDTYMGNFNKNDGSVLEEEIISEFLKNGDKRDIPGIVSVYIEKIVSNKLSFLLFVYVYINVTITVRKFIETLGGEVEDILPEAKNFEDVMININTVEEFKDYMEKILGKAIDLRENKKNNRYGDIIIKAKGYINQNFSDSKLSLNSVAGFVSVSPSHFSTIFAQETGETFIEYLTNIRIRRAMELLKTTNMKMTEITFEVGYSEPHYFSQLFKKITGKSPRNFRE